MSWLRTIQKVVVPFSPQDRADMGERQIVLHRHILGSETLFKVERHRTVPFTQIDFLSGHSLPPVLAPLRP